MAQENPIIVGSAVTAQAGAGARYAFAALGAYALGRGWIHDDTLQLLTVLVSVISPAAYGVWRTYVTNEQKRTIIQSPRTLVPSDVAQVKS